MLVLRSLYKRTLLITLLTAPLLSANLFAQDLSGMYYSRQKDSLKNELTCPTAFLDKATQRRYATLWNKRTQSLVTAINDNRFVHDTIVYPYLDAIVRQITNSNKALLPVKPMLLVDRSPLANAWSPGANIIIVGLGMPVFARTREELALVIAHEMAHNILHHYEWTMQQKAKHTPPPADRQLQHETIADSFAIVLLRNSHIGFDAHSFLHADSSDQILHQPLAHPFDWYFITRQLPYDPAWSTPDKHGLSSAKTTPQEEIATHPDGMNRFMLTRKVAAWRTTPTPLPPQLAEAAEKMLVKNLYESGQLTACLYRILLKMDKPTPDSWYEVMFRTVFRRLYEEDTRLARFDAIDAKPKDILSADYYKLQTMLTQMPHDMLQRYGQIPTPVEAQFQPDPRVLPQPPDGPVQIKPIRRDGSLAGYLVMTQLEKISVDSFIYTITFSDENLNDIGSFTFREKTLLLKAAAAENDALCLTYSSSTPQPHLLIQFITLRGKLLNQYTKRIENDLTLPLELSNIEDKGFTCVYSDEAGHHLLLFSSEGRLRWEKQLPAPITDLRMLTAGPDIYLLTKKPNRMTEGGYELLSYNSRDTSTYPKLLLTDRKGNALKVLGFDKDPVTGKPFVAGLIIDSLKGNDNHTLEQLSQGPYTGVFTIQLNGHRRSDIQTAYSYWNKDAQPFLEKNGLHKPTHSYPLLGQAFRDHQGHTWFAGMGLTRKSHGLFSRNYRYSSSNMLLISQDGQSRLTDGAALPIPPTSWKEAGTEIKEVPQPLYYSSTNPATHNTYLLINSTDSISIYNVTEKKKKRSIPVHNGDIETSVYFAKDGFILVSEVNKKEKTTRLSIEAL